jgi:hypothetical protein
LGLAAAKVPVRREIDVASRVAAVTAAAARVRSEPTGRAPSAAQFSPHAPGPSGCPQEPQGPGAAGADFVVDTAVEKTDSFFSSSVEWQLGQSGTVSERTSVSNSWPHLVHAYS